jgi:hypothetical protein
MPSSFSPSLRIELIGAGEQAGTWGNTTNTNLGTLVEDAISGYVSVTISSANQALTANNGAADQARNAILELVSAAQAFAIYAPPESKQYTVFNNTSYTATIYNSTVLGNTTAAGAGVAIPAGKTMTVWSDGTDFFAQNTHIIGTVVGDVTGTATNATNINISAATSTDTTTSLVLVGDQSTGNQLPFIDSGLNYNANTNTLSTDNVAVGAGTFTTTNWTITESSGKLLFRYAGVTVLSINTNGAVVSADDITAFGTP